MGKLNEAIKNLGTAMNGTAPTGDSTKDLLKSLGATYTGKEITGDGIADVINSIADNYEPALALVVEAVASDVDLLGKTAGELQEDLVVGSNAITGRSKYVTGYTGFSSKTAEQHGNYIGLKATANLDGAVITCELIGGTKGPVTLDEDGMIVLKIANNTQSVRFIATKDNTSKTYNFALTDLVLEEETPAEAE